MRNVRTIVAVAAFAAMNLLLLGPGQPARAQAPAQRNLDAIKRDYVRPAPRPAANQALAGLGRDLFYDPRISASGKSSCAGCHTAELGYVVADAHPINDSGKPTARKSQPLIGIGYAGSAPVGWDGRSPTLEAQAKASIATGSMSMRETDAPVKVETIEARIKSVPEYRAKFAAALPGRLIDIDAIVEAVVAFERTIEPPMTPFDRWGAGNDTAIPESAEARVCVVYWKGWLRGLPFRLAVHRRCVPRYRDHDHGPGARPRSQGCDLELRIQDPDAAIGRTAPALHAQRLDSDARRCRAAL